MELGWLPPVLLSAAPGIVAWTVALVFAARMRKQGGGTPERLLTIGASLMLAQTILHIPEIALTFWFFQTARTHQEILVIGTVSQIVLGLASVAGVICLVIAFWIKFKEKRQAKVAIPTEQ